MIFIGIALALAYAAVMLLYLIGWRNLPRWEIPVGFIPVMPVTVIIPARNEAENIAACLQSILRGTYPAALLEIIVIDDFSTDATAALVAQIAENTRHATVRLTRMADYLLPGAQVSAHKKKALEIAIAQARGDLIVTTDADCIVPIDWLNYIVSCSIGTHRKGALVCAPVIFHREKNVLQRFQSLDFLGLMGITGAGIHLGFQRMGNGANLAYPRDLFAEVDGFAGNENHASGDDLFLIQKVAQRDPTRVTFLKNRYATVRTEAKPDWRSFWQQRLRWSTKNAALPEWPVKFVLGIVFCFCWSMVLLALLAPFWALAGWLLIFQIAVKTVFDFIFLREMCRFFDRRDLMRSFVPAFFLHIFYIAGVGTASLFFKQYNWKGRKVQ